MDGMMRSIGKHHPMMISEVVALFEAVRGHKLELGAILGAFYGLSQRNHRAEVGGY